MIRWITDQLGTAAFTAVPAGTQAMILDVRDLVDKPGNAVAEVRARIDEAVAAVRGGSRVIVCCDLGMSRSNAIAAGVLAVLAGQPLSDAIRAVTAATGEHDIRVSVLGVIRRALQERATSTAPATRPRILVTGGSGFVGRHLCAALAGTREVLAPTRAALDVLRDPVALDLYVHDHQIASVVHLANPRIFTSNAAVGEMVTMMRNVLDVCRNHGLALVYLSEWEVFSGYRTAQHANESLVRHANGAYGEAKLLTEVLLEEFQRNGELRTCVVRSGPVFGQGAERPRFIHNFWAKAMRGETIYTHRYLNGSPALDLVAIQDLVAALTLVIDADATGVLHVGSGVATTTHAIAQILVDLAGSQSTLGEREVDGYATSISMDTTRMHEQFGWSPAVTLRELLREGVRR